jgi:hypothetical protein
VYITILSPPMRTVLSVIFNFALLPGFISLGAAGCSFQREKGGNPDVVLQADGSSPSFIQVRDQVLAPKCSTCHEHQNDFSDYASTYALRDPIQSRVFGDHSMPQNGSLNADQASLLEQWLAAGAPEQAQLPNTPVTPPVNSEPPVVTPVPPTPPGQDPVAAAVAEIRLTFETKIRPLVTRSCTACHDANARPEGLLGDLPGVRQIEWNHIHKASKVLDFTRTFPGWSSQNSDPVFFLDQIRAALLQGSMPPSDFKFSHELDGRLLKSYEKQAIINWTISSELLLARADSSIPTALTVFQNHCMGCHNTGTDAGGLVFENINGELQIPVGSAVGAIPYLTEGSPENSAVYLVLLTNAASRKGLPQMPLKSEALTEQELQIVYDWIKKR